MNRLFLKATLIASSALILNFNGTFANCGPQLTRLGAQVTVGTYLKKGRLFIQGGRGGKRSLVFQGHLDRFPAPVGILKHWQWITFTPESGHTPAASNYGGFYPLRDYFLKLFNQKDDLGRMIHDPKNGAEGLWVEVRTLGPVAQMSVETIEVGGTVGSIDQLQISDTNLAEVIIVEIRNLTDQEIEELKREQAKRQH